MFVLFCDFMENNSFSLGDLIICEPAQVVYKDLQVCVFHFFFFFCMRAAFGLDACCLFPQCVQTVIPLIVGVPVYGFHLFPGR